MNSELLNNEELQERLSELKEGDTLERPGEPLGRFGKMAMRHMHETDTQRYSLLLMQGELMNMMYRVDAEAWEMVDLITRRMEEQAPIPKTDDNMEITRHLNKQRDTAIEIVTKELVMIQR